MASGLVQNVTHVEHRSRIPEELSSAQAKFSFGEIYQFILRGIVKCLILCATVHKGCWPEVTDAHRLTLTHYPFVSAEDSIIVATFRSTPVQNSLLSFALSASLLLRRFSQRLLPAMAAGVMLLFAASAYASTETVTSLLDDGSAGTLRATLASANSGDTIVFSNGLTGAITLASTLTISNNVTIQGPGASTLTISGANQVAVFAFRGALTNASISGLTIANGTDPIGGSAISNFGTLTVSDCTFSNNSAPGSQGDGGAITNLGTLTVSKSTFSGNSAAAGGAIFNTSGPSSTGATTVINSTFSGNSASAFGGGAIFNQTGPAGDSVASVVTVIDSTFSGNSAGTAGGSVILNQSGGPSATVTVNNSIFSGNSATGVGGAILNTQNIGASSIINASDNVFFNNQDVGVGEDDCSSCTTNTSATNADPKLLPLGNYGGDTQTMLPQPGTSATCVGSATLVPSGTTTDQRGFPLVSSCVDAGAVQTNYLLVSTTADSGNGSLRAALGMANSAGFGDIGFSSGVTGTILFLAPLPSLTGQIAMAGPGAGSLTLSGGGSASVGSIFTVNSGAQLSLSGLTIANGNTGGGPGGGISNNGVLTVTNSSFNDNSAGGNEGGAINNSGTLVVSGSSFIGNSSSFGDTGIGGAINNSGTLTVEDSTFSANSSNNGGAICNSNGTATISDSTFSANSSGSAGGGGIFGFGGAVTATNNIFVGNSARVGAGVATSGADSSANLSDNVFFNNLDTGGAEDDCASCTSNTQAVDADPMLAPLGNYGGPVQTMLPQPGSAAICAGSAALATGLTMDQRGFPRTTSYSIAGTPTVCVDAGAVQTNYQSVQFTNVPSSGSYNGVVGIAVSSPAPVVSLTENNQSIGSVPITLLFSGASNTVTGLGPATTASGMGASFNNLIITTAGDNTLSVNLPITAVGANIQPAALTASAAIDIMEQAQTITFGPLPNQPFGTAAFKVSATANSGLTVTFASTTPTVCTVSGSTVNLVSAGTCTIQATQAGNTTFAGATPVSASFTVTMVAPTISFTVPNQSYGAAAFSVSASSNSTGVFTYTVTNGPAIVSGSTLTLTGIGTVTLQASEAADVNYTAGTQTASFTVSATGLQVTANNATRHYGAANPMFTATVLGAKSSDMFSESFTTTATPTSPVGSYVIVPTASGANVGDYTVTTADGALTVTQAPTTTGITASSPSVNANQAGTLTATVLSTTSGTPTGSVTFFDNGTTLQTVTLSGGVASTNPSLSPGTTHVLTASYSGDTNFVASSTSATGVTVAVGALQFTFAGTGANALTVAPGNVAAYTFSISPNFVNYAGPVTFSVTGLPPGATASFNPSTIPVGGGAQSVTMTVQTPAATAHNRTSASPLGGGSKVPAMLSLLLLPLVVNNKLRRRLSTRLLMLVLLMVGLVGLAAITGCGSGDGFSLEDPQTYALTVTATSGSLQQTNAVRLTVQ
jgi:Bacterial Ig-like domain (group 3)/MBG domain (YGX type)